MSTRMSFPTGFFIYLSGALRSTYVLHFVCQQIHISLQLLFTSPGVLLQLIKVPIRMLIFPLQASPFQYLPRPLPQTI